VDLDDFGVFAGCMAGPMASVSPECRCADLDDDGDADLADFAEIQPIALSPHRNGAIRYYWKEIQSWLAKLERVN